MQFPVYLNFFGMTLHPHMVLEALAYATGFSTHMATKVKLNQFGAGEKKAAEFERSLWIVAGAIVGALVGSKLLAWAENWHALTAPQAETVPGLERWLGGKTVVGGLIGGWCGVEIAKRCTGIRQKTGDTWVYPLILSMCIGRVGCFLTGLADQTHGIATTLPWGVDFGDGIRRHPTQLYEIVFLLLLGLALLIYQRTAHLGFATGRLFRWFMLGYCTWRFFVEFIKPTDKPWLGLSAIQIVSLIACAVTVVSLLKRNVRIARFSENLTHD